MITTLTMTMKMGYKSLDKQCGDTRTIKHVGSNVVLRRTGWPLRHTHILVLLWVYLHTVVHCTLLVLCHC